MRDDIVIDYERTHPKGGQHAGMDHGVLIGTHPETGIVIRIPPILERSQHRRKVMIDEAMTWILLSAGYGK